MPQESERFDHVGKSLAANCFDRTADNSDRQIQSDVNGALFASGATINFGTTALATTRISSAQLTATGRVSGGSVRYR